MKYKYVYVAGPITNGDTLLNIRDGIAAGTELLKLGYMPYIPHNDFIQYMLHPDVLTYEAMLDWDLAWIERCDALLRLRGDSPGADREVAHAILLGLFVSDSIQALEEANGRGA